MNEKPTNIEGRPWKYASKEKLQEDIDKYLKDCKKRQRPPTMAGMALALNMSRQTLINYGRDELFGSVIARARLQVEQWWEEELPVARGSGVQFNLKNNFGWRDRSEQEITGAGGAPLTTRIIVDYGDDE